MPIPVTKIFLSSTVTNALGGYRMFANAAGDLQQSTLNTVKNVWLSGIADLNSDGISDFIVGGSGDDDFDVNAGRIYVRFGEATGGTLKDLPDSDNGLIIDGMNAGDLTGGSVGSVSDLNSDGLAEILVGAAGNDFNGAEAGTAFVLWGQGAGSGGIDVANAMDEDKDGYAIIGQAAGDRAGEVVASIADLNGGGKAEILVGATGNDQGGTDAGAGYVVWGKNTVTHANLSSVATGTGGFKIYGEAAGDAAGGAMAAIADQNGDGKANILIGAAGNDAGGADAGAAYVVFGKSTGTAVNLDSIAAGVGGYKIIGAAGDHAGLALAALGDVNADGIADILVGAPGTNKAYVVFGKSSTTAVNLTDVAAGIGGFAITAEAGSSLADISVAAGGDFNRDGIADFVIGTPHNGEGGVNAGAVYAVWGGDTRTVDLSLVASGIGGAKIVGAAGSLTGSSVATLGDLNGDGTPDLLIGSPGSSYESASVVYAPTSWQPDSNVYGTNGADTMGVGYGGLHKISTGNDSIYGLNSNDSINAGDGHDVVDGGAGADTIEGAAGNDTLDGGVGADSLVGGAGDDTYLVDNAGDSINEAAGEGTDTAIVSANYTLGENVENLQLTGAAHSGTGNSGNNTITAGSGSDTLDGGAGADTLNGGSGNDTYKVDNAGDVVQENPGGGTDTIITTIDLTLSENNVENLTLSGAAHSGTGNSGSNTLTGTSGSDTLDGGAGVDTLNGGGGDDTYKVDHASDVVQEAAGGGTDTVIASVSYILGNNAENLQLTGSAHVGTGNSGDNHLTGTAGNDTLDGASGADTLTGGAGDDTYKVDNTSDVVEENAGGGTDTVVASFDYTLTSGAEIENLQLTGSAHHGTGNAGDNVITGGTGGDTLDGGAGADTLAGGAGDDTYLVDGSSDTIQENAGEGTDTVVASEDYTLGAELENLVLMGAADHGVGNGGDNSISGGLGNDSLEGMGGNDTLDGSAGADTMAGGAGDDTYYVDDVNDVVQEDVGGGTDLVVANFDYTLGENIESVRIEGAAHSVTGNSGDNHISGSSGADTIDGAEGDDVELGGDGDDVLISDAGLDSLSGGSGDDRYMVSGGHAEIEDFLGHDTIDASDASGDSYIDLSGDDVSHVEGEDVHLGTGGSTFAPLDVQFLQDLSGSFGDDIATVRGLVPAIVTALQTAQPNSMFGSSTFVDKPVSPFGAAGEWVYETALPLTSNVATLTSTYNSLAIRYGADEPEAQIEALMQLALHQAEVGYRPDSARFAVLFTDAPFHVAGDGIAAGITTPNNGDAIADGTPAGTGEDYPGIAQVKTALEAANIIPIFAIANGYESVYQGLVTSLGRGSVVTLTSDSSNVVTALTNGLTAATATHIEDAWGGTGDDTIKGSADDNALLGNAGDDSLMGAGGDDSLDGGDGTDTATYTGAITDYTVVTTGGITTVIDLNAGDGDDGSDSLSNVEVLSFVNGSVNLTTFTYTGTAGDDTCLVFNDNPWTLDGQDGNDNLSGRNGSDTILGGAGDDTLSGSGGNDRLFGGLGADSIAGDSGRDRIEGNEGNDTIDGGIGNDTIRGGEGNDSLLGDSGDDTIYGGTEDDYINGGNSADLLLGEAGNDTLWGGSSNDSLRGGDGNDYANGESGSDDIRMGAGNDTLNGGAGTDKLYGEAGADTFVFDAQMFGARDSVKDFSAAEGDVLRIEGVFIGFDALTSFITDFVKFTNAATIADLYIDRDGSGSAYDFERIATLEHTSALSAQTLWDAGNLMAL